MCMSIVIRSVAVYIICGLFVNKTLQTGLLVLLASLGNGGTIPKGDPDKFNPVIVIVLSQLFHFCLQNSCKLSQNWLQFCLKKVALHCEVSQICCKKCCKCEISFSNFVTNFAVKICEILVQIPLNLVFQVANVVTNSSVNLWNFGAQIPLNLAFQVGTFVTNFVVKICEILVCKFRWIWLFQVGNFVTNFVFKICEMFVVISLNLVNFRPGN